jgi:hypothetical protein
MRVGCGLPFLIVKIILKYIGDFSAEKSQNQVQLARTASCDGN